MPSVSSYADEALAPGPGAYTAGIYVSDTPFGEEDSMYQREAQSDILALEIARNAAAAANDAASTASTSATSAGQTSDGVSAITNDSASDDGISSSTVDTSSASGTAVGPGASSAGDLASDDGVDAATQTQISPNYSVTERDGQTIYTFEGKEYVAGSSYGVHKISGYSPMENGSAHTASGRVAAARHTLAASSDLPLGTVLILSGSSGPYSELYNGMYVVEDRGGYYLESEGWLDIYFDTYAEAVHVSAAGWNYVEAVIAIPLD